MTFVFKATQDGSIEQAFTVGSDITNAEVYTSAGNKGGISWNFVGNASNELAFQLYQNNPNPFRDETQISFDLTEEMEATLTIQDVTGRVVKVITKTFAKGNNVVNLTKSELISSGMLYYTLEAGSNKATRKMIVIE